MVKKIYNYIGIGFWIGGGVYSLINMILNYKHVIERMKELLKEDFQNYMKILKKAPVKSIRCNTLKISPNSLKERLEKKGWSIKQPFKNYPEIMIIENEILPGELGRSLEHL